MLAALTADLGDDHTYYVNPGSYQQQLRAIAGQGSSKTRFGLRTAHLPGSNARVVLNVREDGPAKPEDFRRGDRIYAVDGQAFPNDPGENDALWNRLEAGGQAVVLSAMRDAAKGRAACRSTLILESARQVQGAANLETRLISSKFFTCNFRPSLSASNL